MKLSELDCEACRTDSPAVVGAEREALLAQLDGWQVVRDGGVDQLRRRYDFEDFVTALAFTNAVGELAEAEDHHPSLVTEWGRVTVSWWTHTINGLHRNDFILAARCDERYGAGRGADA